MASQIQAVRGMNDILPSEVHYWQALEKQLGDLMSRYTYQEIRFPIIEDTSLFIRSVGETSDIVEKETYTFTDRNNDSLTLRPEGTAGCVRALIQQGVLASQPVQRLWYAGPMFRHERPQKGRYRQFHQCGVEAYGMSGADIVVELLAMGARLWQTLNLTAHIKLQLNSLGTTSSREAYRSALVSYFTEHFTVLDEDSQRRLGKNPLRILDSKNPDMQVLIQRAPKITDYLEAAEKQELDLIGERLTLLGIAYEINPRLVRGLDYYTGIVFEWITDSLGAQGAVCAGGRYDHLVESLGGPATPAIGFAMGLERLVLLMKEYASIPPFSVDVYLLSVGEMAEKEAIKIAEKIRTALPHLRVQMHCGSGSFKSQFKKADKSGAALALVLGDTEVEQQSITLKYLREEREQITIPQQEMVESLNTYFRRMV
jgi:histidyl-tRNA synthetase